MPDHSSSPRPDTPPQRCLIVTPEQLKSGYAIKAAGAIWKGQYTVLRKLDDGSYLVDEPKPWKEFIR